MQKTSSHGPLMSTTYYVWSSSLGYLCGLQEEDFEVWAPKKKGGKMCAAIGKTHEEHNK